uniref:Death domain-containing protein n=1 Tax=Amphimedon queenslandica TaxID=400682 RepID=A0A1X7SYP1_AMPQE
MATSRATSPSSSAGSAPFINVCDKELSIDEYHSVYDKVKPISASWKSFAISLRLRITDINIIEASSHGNTISCLQKVLEYWLKKNYDYESHGIPCWRMVCVAVKEGGGNPALANEIAREHPLPATVGVSINVIHSEGMSPGSSGGYNSNDNDILLPLPSADRRDISSFDDAMSPGSGKSNSSTCTDGYG